MYLKKRLPAWLHADMEHLQNRIFNYVFHGRVNLTDRHEIQTKWNKIKHEMDSALENMDDAVAHCSVKCNDKVTICPPKAR
jgi:hypothetical protein